MKKLKKFTIFMIIYVVLWIVAIVGISIYVWNGLTHYQKDYEDAVAGSVPELFMDKLTANVTVDELKEYLAKDDSIEVGPYETREIADEYIAEYLNFKGNITYKKHEKYSDGFLAYTLMSDGKDIADIAILRHSNIANNKPDTFTVKSCVFSNYVQPEHSIKIKKCPDTECTINGVTIKETEKINEGQRKNRFAKEVEGLTGDILSYEEYKISKLYSNPSVVAKSPDGRILLDENTQETEYSFIDNVYEGFTEEISDMAFEKILTYSKYINRNITYEAYISTLKSGTQIAEIADNAKSGLKWNDEALEITSSDLRIDNIIRVNDTMFIADVGMKINMKFEKYSKSENIDYQCVFEKDSNGWYIIYISVK